MSFEQLVADAGYDSEANHHHCRERLRVDSLIPAKKRRSAKVAATTPYRREMCRRLGEPGHPSDRAAYRQRWRVEAVMSVVKRRCGEALTARLEPTQRAQALLRGVGYNVRRLVRLGFDARGFRQSKALLVRERDANDKKPERQAPCASKPDSAQRVAVIALSLGQSR